MFNPVQLFQIADHRPVDYYADQLDEEHYAQRYGSVAGPHFGSRFSLWLGRLLIKMGEQLTGECRGNRLSRETA